jgi:hypothetical protein
MSREHVLRPALWTAAFFNLVGTFLFAFPASRLGQFAGLPSDAPAIYRALTALFVLLFGCAYAWLAMQPAINRPFVAFGAIGKAGAFLIVVLLWLRGAAPITRCPRSSAIWCSPWCSCGACVTGAECHFDCNVYAASRWLRMIGSISIA